MREMNMSVTSGAEGHQIFFHIWSERAPGASTLDLEIAGAAAPFTAPSIPLKYLVCRFLVRADV